MLIPYGCGYVYAMNVENILNTKLKKHNYLYANVIKTEILFGSFYLKMEKSIAVQQLALPSDVVNYICSFIFYQEIDVMIRNVGNYNVVLKEFKRVRREVLPLSHPNASCFYYILPRGNQLITSVSCSICGNYVKPSRQPRIFICQCV
jgi:hypothetical protein